MEAVAPASIPATINYVTQAGTYLFTHYGYDGHDLSPQLMLERDDHQLVPLAPRGQTITLCFDKGKRFCVGWHDLATAVSSPCPESAIVPDQFDQCHHCRQKTGFNPAFYHAASVSEQQQARNREPHSLYLAHFGPGVVKVGITWAQRGIRRLLDQGARSAIVVKTYPNADIARQYEAKIAKLPGIAETLQVRVKQGLLDRPYDAQAGAAELRQTLERIAQEVTITPESTSPLHLDPYYVGEQGRLDVSLVDLSSHKKISGHCVGMVGSVLITEQDKVRFCLSLTKLKGYRVELSYTDEPNDCAPQQISLF